MLTGLEKERIVIAGAGRLATQLGLAFHRKGIAVSKIYNRSADKGKKLARRIQAQYVSDIRDLEVESGICILAVSDAVLVSMAESLQMKSMLVAHTSGTVGMDVLAPVGNYTGVFYPLQTFTLSSRVDFFKVPVCIEGNSDSAEQRLVSLASGISGTVIRLDSSRRRVLHLSAVFASNFTNFMYAVAEDILSEHDLPVSILEPLVLRTAQNIRGGDLLGKQTGPAARGDAEILRKHRELLAGHTDYQAIYDLMSEHIQKHVNLWQTTKKT